MNSETPGLMNAAAWMVSFRPAKAFEFSLYAARGKKLPYQ
jgi:hypothetical protein